MSAPQKITPLRSEDYEAIESAVVETARGRWFLREYAHRNRTADTNMLLDAIGRIENALALNAIDTLGNSIEIQASAEIDTTPLIQVIDNARAEISAIRDELLEDGPPHSIDPLAATAASADGISAGIFEQARGLQETVFKLRDDDADIALCDRLDECAEKLMRICQKQDLNARRTAEAMRALQDLDNKLSGGSDVVSHKTNQNKDADEDRIPVKLAAPVSDDDYYLPDFTDPMGAEDLEVLPSPEEANVEDVNDDGGHIVFVETDGNAPEPPLVNCSSDDDSDQPGDEPDTASPRLQQAERAEHNDKTKADEKPLVFVP